jgi:regulator of protease activity HflC (stomatin/prohibitin superfamily)
MEASAVDIQSLVQGVVLAIVAIVLLLKSLRICREGERLAVFRLGRFHAVKGPGLALILPLLDVAQRVDLNQAAPNWRHLPRDAIERAVRDHALRG